MATPDNPHVDTSQLSESQQLALQQYTALTDQGVTAAIPLLQRSQWNVEVAIAKFFDGEGPDPVAEALAAQNQPPPRVTRQENLQESLTFDQGSPSRLSRNADPAPRIVPQPEDHVIRRPPFLLSLLFSPFSLLYKVFSGAIGLFSYLVPYLPRVLQPTMASNNIRRISGGRRSLRPRDAAARFRREFEEEFGEHSLPFYDGGYAQALDLAKKDLTFLLVLLVSPEHDDTSSFIRETILSTDVQNYLSNTDLLLWIGDVRDSEAYQVSTALSCSKFPFTAVIAHNPKISNTAMSVIERVIGPMDASEYIAKLRAAISSHEEHLAGVRAARSAQNFDRNLREEQESAYERSLAQDRARAQQKREADAAAAAQAQKEKEDSEAKEKLSNNREAWRIWRAQSLREEPPATEKDCVRIAMKMRNPNTGRIVRRFQKDDPVEELYAFVDCYEINKQLEAVSRPDGYEHCFDFRLVQALPRKVYDVAEGGSIGERIGGSANLIVEPILEEVDADEEDSKKE